MKRVVKALEEVAQVEQKKMHEEMLAKRAAAAAVEEGSPETKKGLNAVENNSAAKKDSSI